MNIHFLHAFNHICIRLVYVRCQIADRSLSRDSWRVTERDGEMWRGWEPAEEQRELPFAQIFISRVSPREKA